jgi:hypothetical protein
MKEEFYAVIKLISSEEIFAKVCPCEEEDRTILILEDPVSIECVSIQKYSIEAYKINPWVKFTDETMFMVNMDKVITISEVKDDYMIKMYEKFVRSKNKKPNKKNPSSNMGYLSSISDARISLEKLYKSKDI